LAAVDSAALAARSFTPPADNPHTAAALNVPWDERPLPLSALAACVIALLQPLLEAAVVLLIVLLQRAQYTLRNGDKHEPGLQCQTGHTAEQAGAGDVCLV
jgi:hypothetical protein